MINALKAWLVWTLVLFAAPAVWADTVNFAIGESFRDVSIGKNIEYLQVSPEQYGILPGPDSEWQHYDKSRIVLGIRDGAFWFRFKLSNATATQLKLLLAIEYPLIDNVQMYRVDGSDTEVKNAVKVGEVGDILSFDERQIKDEKLLLPITLAAKQSSVIYLQVINDGIFDVALHLYDPHVYIEKNGKNHLRLGLFFGFLLATIFSSLSLYLVTNNRKFALLGFSITMASLSLLTLFGIGNRFFWPNLPWWQQHILPILLGLTFISVTVFGSALLNLRKLNIRLLQLVRGFIGIGWLLVVISVFVRAYLSTLMMLTYALILAFTMLSIGIYSWRNNVNGAELFSVSWAVSFMSFVYVIVWAQLGFILPLEALDVFVLNAILSTVLLFIALLQQYIGHKSQQIAVQQQAISDIRSHDKMQQQMLQLQEASQEELEVSIQERTFELEVTLRELEEKNRELEQKNTQDPLTGIRNRRFFDKKYQAEFRRSRREQTELSLIMLDIDHFKKVNDNHGHLAGDDVIRFVGRIIEDILKRPSDEVCRYGGEEFALILPSTDSEGARQLAQTIRQAIAKANIETQAGLLSITVSCGICTAVAQSSMTDHYCIEMADKGLYAAKVQGRNCVVHSDDMVNENQSVAGSDESTT
jgi:diguanylate cyclase (GGDEF)-like protein